MNHFNFFPTSVEKLHYYSNKWNINLLCKRDDLFPKAIGGNKARMLQYILYPLVTNKVDILLTAGGPCSNFNCATALMCAELGIHMKLVSYTDNLSEYENSLSYYLCRLAGVEFVFCKKNEVSSIIQDTISDMLNKKNKFYYLYGGGKSLEGVYAYYDAIKELRVQYEGEINELYIACGTGTTLTGICGGMQEFFPEAVVHAISVARKYLDEKKVIDDNMLQLNTYLGTSYDFSNLIYHDEYILDGYACVSCEELKIIHECTSKQGMLIDPTYSGKAFYGMSQILLKKKNNKKKTVLFWNTGGIMNLLSQREEFKL